MEKARIQRLPDHIANQIAAGEVIQRPASVIKELIENAIDAGANRIDVVIKGAGKTLIKVVDNGCGMGASDADMCFERHATSKIRKADDLFSLVTKGFRGEALASIAAIAHVDMKTRLSDEETGTHLCIEGSKKVSLEETVCPSGTSFEIKNLFYNVPARRNFLKSDNVEFRHIQDEFERVALAHPDVHFSLTHNENELHNLNAGPLRKRVVDVFGKKTNDRLVPIEESTDIVQLHGFVLKPEFSRKTRGEQYFFVNNRYFKSAYFNHAIHQAFDGLLKEKTFPGYVLYLTVPTDKIDVNVHPTKTEIKFEEEKFIYSILLSSARQALGKYNITPTLDFEREVSFDLPASMRNTPATEPTIQLNPDYNPFKSTSGSSSSESQSHKNKKESYKDAIRSQGFGTQEASADDWKNFYSIGEEEEKEEQSTIPMEDEIPAADNFLVKGSYILVPSKSGFMVIHARRAIEQIVYTSIINSFISNPVDSQAMLFPVEKELSKREKTAWIENETILKQLGFEARIKDDTLQLAAVPNVWQQESIQSGIDHVFSVIAYGNIDKGDIAHGIVASIASAAAMKKLDLRTSEHVEKLIEQLFQCENHMHTPGNKKIIDTLPMEAITHKFN